jgi:F-type H+-transporting ATPase subunit delta
MPTEVESEIAQRYAQALFNVSRERGRLKEHLAELDVLHHVVTESRDFLAFLSAPHIDRRTKLEFLRRTLGTRFSPATMRLIEVLVDYDRITALLDIVGEFGNLVDRWRGIREAVVRTATALDESQKRRVQDTLERLLSAKLKIEFSIDADLIGGIIVQADDKMIDASVRGELNRLKYQLEQTSLASAEVTHIKNNL